MIRRMEETTANSAVPLPPPKKSKKLWLWLIILNLAIVFETGAGICEKFAAQYQVLSWPFIGIYALAIFFLGIYALVWQQVIKRMQLSVAYTSKAVGFIWALLFSILLFGEAIGVWQIVGIVVIIIGVVINNWELVKK